MLSVSNKIFHKVSRINAPIRPTPRFAPPYPTKKASLFFTQVCGLSILINQGFRSGAVLPDPDPTQR